MKSLISIENNSDNQMQSLKNLVGKFAGSKIRKSSLRHLSRIRNLVNTIRDARALYANVKSRNSYLLNQISERDLMLDDCYESLIKVEIVINELGKKIETLESENQKLRAYKKLEVVA